MPAFAGRYSIWRMSGRVKRGGQLQALGSLLVLLYTEISCLVGGRFQDARTRTMPVNRRIGTQVIWIATLTCAVSECALLAMGIGPLYGIAMVGSVLDRSQVSHDRSGGWMWMHTKSNCFSRLSAILPRGTKRWGILGEEFCGGDQASGIVFIGKS